MLSFLLRPPLSCVETFWLFLTWWLLFKWLSGCDLIGGLCPILNILPLTCFEIFLTISGMTKSIRLDDGDAHKLQNFICDVTVRIKYQVFRLFLLRLKIFWLFLVWWSLLCYLNIWTFPLEISISFLVQNCYWTFVQDHLRNSLSGWLSRCV